MNAIAIKNWVIAVAALAALYILFRLYRWITEKGPGGVARDTADFTANVVGGLAVGTVEGVSRTVGIPKTDPAQCEKDRAAGAWWDASFSCDAGTFSKALFNRVFSTEPLKNSAINVVPADVSNSPTFKGGESFFPR